MVLRLIRVALVGLLLLQSAVLAPAAMALESGQAMADCGDQMGTGDKDCPCCPQAVSTSAGCGTTCLGIAAGLSSAVEIFTTGTEQPGPGFLSSLLASQVYAPVNPPPIV